MQVAKLVDLQIRKIPAELRDKLRRRAASKGVSMSRYVIEALRDDLERPASIDEWLAEVERLPRLSRLPKGQSGAEIIREVRREAEEEIGEEIDR